MIRNREKIKYFFKSSGISVALFIAVGIGALSTLSLTSNNDNIISLIVSTKNNPYFAELISAAENEVKKYPGWTVRVFDSQDKDDEQVKNIDLALALNSKAVVINPVNSSTAANAGVKRIVDQKIPIVAVDRGVDGLNINWTIASDNVLGATGLAESFKTKVLGATIPTIPGDQILELQGVSGSQASTDRDKGFNNVFPIPSINKKRANFNRDEAKTETDAYLATDTSKKTKLIFAENDEMALGAIQALNTPFSTYVGTWAGRPEGGIYVLGFDGTDDALQAIKNNIMYATVIQQPSFMGKTAIVKIIEQFELGTLLPLNEKIDSPTIVVDKSNVDQFIK